MIVRTIDVRQHNAIIQVHQKDPAVHRVTDAFIEEEITETEIEFNQAMLALHAYVR